MEEENDTFNEIRGGKLTASPLLFHFFFSHPMPLQGTNKTQNLKLIGKEHIPKELLFF